MNAYQALLSAVAPLLATAATAIATVPVVQEWYVPQPEAQLREDYSVLASNTNSTFDSVIAVTVPVAGTRIVFDHCLLPHKSSTP